MDEALVKAVESEEVTNAEAEVRGMGRGTRAGLFRGRVSRKRIQLRCRDHPTTP